MKNSWLIWVFIAGVVITVLVAFNYQGSNNETVPLSEIFPEEQSYPVAADYEFADETPDQVAETTAPTEVRKVQTAAETATEEKTQEIAKATTQATTPTTKAVTEEAASTTTNKNTTVPTVTDLKKIPYTIQAASFKDKASAEEVATKMREKGYLAFVVGRDLGAKGTWYRVYVGEFNTKTEADTSLTEVKKDYKDSFVISIAPLR
ncbi:MAG: SPOR domain-containing protein [Candidatus Omnitrophica bacterium]|nr:SPOR domain-containing protein [Candidatus Omnitrophota bacterium]